MTARDRLSGGTLALILAGTLPALAATERTVHDFNARARGRSPAGGLVALGTTLFGTTQYGGAAPCVCGTVYAINAAGQESVIYSFAGGAEGGNPAAALTLLNGVLYGTTQTGGASGQGVIFSITPTGAYTVLHSIDGISGGSNYGALAALDGTLYGMTYGGFPTGCGIAYSITPAGTYTLLHNFGSASAEPCGTYGPLTTDGHLLYGTSFYGGITGNGTVFSMTPSGTVQVIHAFATANVYPGGVTPFRGKLYGTTEYGGDGLGDIYSVTPSDVFTELHAFDFTDGSQPLGTLTVSGNTLYGTTLFGGDGACSLGHCGTVFGLQNGTRFFPIHSFSGADGQYPTTTVTITNNTLYGTTNQGGAYGYGIVFSVIP